MTFLNITGGWGKDPGRGRCAWGGEDGGVCHAAGQASSSTCLPAGASTAVPLALSHLCPPLPAPTPLELAPSPPPSGFRDFPLGDLPMLEVLRQASEGVFVPLTVGGGIREFTDGTGKHYSALQVAAEYFR